jgi:predicted DNA-binding transcriptional regulator AlpA
MPSDDNHRQPDDNQIAYQWLPMPDAMATTGLSQTTVYRRIKAGTFRKDTAATPMLVGIPIEVESDNHPDNHVETDGNHVVTMDVLALPREEELTRQLAELREQCGNHVATVKEQMTTIRQQMETIGCHAVTIESQQRCLTGKDENILALTQTIKQLQAPIDDSSPVEIDPVITIRGANGRRWYQFWR